MGLRRCPGRCESSRRATATRRSLAMAFPRREFRFLTTRCHGGTGSSSILTNSELRKTGHPTILAGDFNVVPSDFDIYSTRSYADNALLQAELRDAYANLLKRGWTDALRMKHPKEPMFTFRYYLRNR